tara:strand:- start:853 stop:1002 length:150 start_codon:yes stop_codon:yes gene_type:complete
MYKVRDAMKSIKKFPMMNRDEVNEFVVGGKDDEKVGRNYITKKKSHDST